MLRRDVLTEYGVGPVKGLNCFLTPEYEVISGLVLPQHIGIFKDSGKHVTAISWKSRWEQLECLLAEYLVGGFRARGSLFEVCLFIN